MFRIPANTTPTSEYPLLQRIWIAESERRAAIDGTRQRGAAIIKVRTRTAVVGAAGPGRELGVMPVNRVIGMGFGRISAGGGTNRSLPMDA
ncbi:hypothetical protein [Nocardia nepalensis]|uniref:hypothetical protein n=1 Tax=Nocardia nepalensis TaxID=3375448 RepID=UPI003B67358A